MKWTDLNFIYLLLKLLWFFCCLISSLFPPLKLQCHIRHSLIQSWTVRCSGHVRSPVNQTDTTSTNTPYSGGTGCYTPAWIIVQSTAATPNYGHLEATVKAGKRGSMERDTLVMKIMTISILEGEKRVYFKHAHRVSSWCHYTFIKHLTQYFEVMIYETTLFVSVLHLKIVPLSEC